MIKSCINWSETDRYVVLREDYKVFCGGNICAAMLLSFFEREFTANPYPEWRSYTENELADSILHFYGKTVIGGALNVLERLGVLKVGRNPNTRYRFDRTRYFALDLAPFFDWAEKKEAGMIPEPDTTYRDNLVQSRRQFSRIRNAVLRASERVCVYCGGLADTIDHVVPLCRGGTNDVDNLVPCCHACNMRKGRKTAAEYESFLRDTLEQTAEDAYFTQPKGER